jgi:cytochrome c553
MRTTAKSRGNRSHSTRQAFAAIAFWQFAAFVMLILLIWVNGVLDLPYLLFGTKQAGLNLFECSVLTSGVVITAIITVGHTYVRQKKVASSLITVCSACHKVRVSREGWGAIEDYVSEHSDMLFSHGLCPDCFERSMSESDSDAPTMLSANTVGKGFQTEGSGFGVQEG